MPLSLPRASLYLLKISCLLTLLMPFLPALMQTVGAPPAEHSQACHLHPLPPLLENRRASYALYLWHKKPYPDIWPITRVLPEDRKDSTVSPSWHSSCRAIKLFLDKWWGVGDLLHPLLLLLTTVQASCQWSMSGIVNTPGSPKSTSSSAFYWLTAATSQGRSCRASTHFLTCLTPSSNNLLSAILF